MTVIGFKLHTREPVLHGPVLLQSLCGLRVLEALNLRKQDVNFDAGTITITETERHRPKNRFSFRILPVTEYVLDALRGAIESLPTDHDSGASLLDGLP